MILHGGVHQARIDAAVLLELQPVHLAQLGEAVRAIEELVRASKREARRVRHELRNGRHGREIGVALTHHEHVGVAEPERRHDNDPEIVQQGPLDGAERSGLVGDRLALENAQQYGTRVFGIHIDLACLQRAERHMGTGQVQLAIHLEIGVRLQHLSEHFAQDELLGEILRADGDLHALGAGEGPRSTITRLRDRSRFVRAGSAGGGGSRRGSPA